MNPLLRSPDGRFGSRGALIKTGITGGAIGLEWMCTRTEPRARRKAALINLILSGVLIGAAAKNYGTPKARPLGPGVTLRN